MAKLEAGARAPAFTLKDQHGKDVSLSDYAGKHVVVYFYPRDDTPGCTREACAFRDAKAAFAKAGAVVLGVSKDTEASHAKFAKKFELPFSLLADTERQVMEAWGAWGEKTMYGKKVQGTIRSTVLVGPDGKVVKVWPNVKVDGHADQVLAALSGGTAEQKKPQRKASRKDTSR
jgi:peroxiredoxin Q/BCP